MNFDKLERIMQGGVAQVTFTKADGSIRVMDATLASYLLPKTRQDSNHPKGETFIVYDLDAEGWRSFRKDRLISYEEL
jgi:hypothetical protein